MGTPDRHIFACSPPGVDGNKFEILKPLTPPEPLFMILFKPNGSQLVKSPCIFDDDDPEVVIYKAK
jgi:hypothetical protein